MKVLIINSVRTQKNGITNVIFNYLCALNFFGMTIDYLSINKPEKEYVEIIEKKGGRLFVIPRLSKNIINYYSRLKQLISQNKYDIVHIHGNSHTLVLDLLAAKRAGCKIRIVHAHSTTSKFVLLHKLLAPPFFKLCTHRLACGYEAGVWMFGRHKFEIINNGVDTKAFAYDEVRRKIIREKIGIQAGVLLGHVGLFSENKNQSFIVDILKDLNEKGENFYLLLIGDGPTRCAVENYAKESGIRDRIIFTGNINDVCAYLNAIDIVVMPSFHEGLPLTLIEQQVNGLQCVASDTITKEVDKTGNMIFLSLNLSASEWANCVIGINCGMGRAERSKEAIRRIKSCGYDIITEAQHLNDYYKAALMY